MQAVPGVTAYTIAQAAPFTGTSMMSTPETEAQALNEHFLEITPSRDEEKERQRASAALVCD
jgi:hypothetical protein